MSLWGESDQRATLSDTESMRLAATPEPRVSHVIERFTMALLCITAAAAVTASAALALTCGHAIGRAIRSIYPFDLAIPFAILCGVCALVKPALAVALVAKPSTRAAALGAAAMWLVLLMFNVLCISKVVTAYNLSDGIAVGELWLWGAALVLEITSGALPALVFALHRARSAPLVPAAGAADRVSLTPSLPPGQAKAPVTKHQGKSRGNRPCYPPGKVGAARHSAPRFSSLRELVAYIRVHGGGEFPELICDSEGGVLGPQRAFARILGLRSPSSLNRRLWKEEAAGTIVVAASGRYTRVTLPT